MAATAVAIAVRPRSRVLRQRQHETLRRFRRSQRALVGGLLLFLVLLCAVLPPFLGLPSSDLQDLASRLKPPVWAAGGSAAHILGTDTLGRDLLSRVLEGARVSMQIAGVGVVIAGAFGVVVGLLGGYYRGAFDSLVMRLAEVQLSFPYLLLAIAVMALFRPGLTNLIIVLALRSWVVYARTVRSLVIANKEREFVESAVAVGATGLRIIFKHLAPNVIAPVIVISSFQLAELIIVEASLSFLGLGVQPPTPTWGAMLAEGREYMSSAWWLAVFPGLGIVVTVLGTNLLGDGLRDVLDPRMKV